MRRFRCLYAPTRYKNSGIEKGESWPVNKQQLSVYKQQVDSNEAGTRGSQAGRMVPRQQLVCCLLLTLQHRWFTLSRLR